MTATGRGRVRSATHGVSGLLVGIAVLLNGHEDDNGNATTTLICAAFALEALLLGTARNGSGQGPIGFILATVVAALLLRALG